MSEHEALGRAIDCYNHMLRSPPVVRKLAFDVWWSWCEVLLIIRHGERPFPFKG